MSQLGHLSEISRLNERDRLAIAKRDCLFMDAAGRNNVRTQAWAALRTLGADGVVNDIRLNQPQGEVRCSVDLVQR